MPNTRSSTSDRSSDRSATRPGGARLKAERIQLIVFLDRGNRPYDFASETAAERTARLEAGWRKRIGRGDRTSRRRPDAA